MFHCIDYQSSTPVTPRSSHKFKRQFAITSKYNCEKLGKDHESGTMSVECVTCPKIQLDSNCLKVYTTQFEVRGVPSKDLSRDRQLKETKGQAERQAEC